jgi:hypothetical protein
MSASRKICWTGLLTLAVIFILSAGCQVKDDAPEPNPEQELDIYVAGYLHNDEVYNCVYVPCYWKDGQRIDLIPFGAADKISIPEWPRGISGYALSMFVDGDDVYVAGFVNREKACWPCLPCYWKNGTRIDLDLGSADEGEAFGICISEGDVYQCGYVEKYGGGRMPCYWKNGIRIDLPCSRARGFATSISVSPAGVYVSGYNWGAFGYWGNGSWTPLFGSDQGGALDSIAVSGSDVYAAGWTDSKETQNVPSYWKNGVRNNLIVLAPPRSGRANAVFAAGGSVYVAGWTKSDLIIAVPCYWKNGVRTDLSVLAPNDPTLDLSSANSIQALGSNVYVAGETYYMEFGPYTRWHAMPCYWKNGVRTDLSIPSQTHMMGYGRSIFVTSK